MEERTPMRERVKDLLLAISWREMARHYFQKSSSWMYHKLDGTDDTGINAGFNESETEQLKGALYDLSERIRRVADSI